MNLNKMSNATLLEKVEFAAAEEKRITTELLKYLAEVERRRLYAELGFSSMHLFCTKHLRMSKGSAYRRISSMREMRTLQETKVMDNELIESETHVEDALRSGEVSVTNLSSLHRFIR